MDMQAVRRCRWCEGPLPDLARSDIEFCQKKCRQTAWRLRHRNALADSNAEPKRIGYADPPYPGLASYYRGEPSYAGEVDHKALIERLVSEYDGWALSTSSDALRMLLPLCPPEIKVRPWVKPIGVSTRTFGAHNTWEPVLVMPARALRPGFRDWLCTPPARGGGTLIGRKPLKFCAWLFQQLGMLPGDELDDLFPGTGIVGRAWRELSAQSRRCSSSDASADVPSDESREALGDASRPGSSDASPTPADDESPSSPGDASARARGDGYGGDALHTGFPREMEPSLVDGRR